MSHIAAANDRIAHRDRFHQSAVVDEATNPTTEGVIASPTTDKLADDGPCKRMIGLWQAVNGTLQPWPVVRMLLAALLLVTGVLKATHSAELLASGGLLGSPAAIASAVGLEWFAAAFIAIGPVRLAQRFAFVLFSVFTLVATWAWWTDQDCGCFGPQTPKGVPLLIDTAALLLVAWSVRSQRKSARVAGPAFQSLRASLVAGSMLAALSGGFTAWNINHQATAKAMPSWFGENLIGKEFPLLADPRFAALVPEQGEVLIVMLRPDCEHCRELVEQWSTTRQELRSTTKVIGISVSPGRWTVMPDLIAAVPTNKSADTVITWKDTEPFVASPRVVALKNRIVTDVQPTLKNFGVQGVSDHHQDYRWQVSPAVRSLKRNLIQKYINNYAA
ncbi:DoxX family protein [Allorhodopirellula solitaria]|uniref:Methylamine utilisation protein MauE domain-containing protein n=1 Tax=Allorhodopirellula solitaria TaxID=2527987 RepID=A0A5C5YK48_9BACT|nr:DoxX family protein [Allorhodopirellula solitaria]TWT75285.1 hypothetical protein CA85_05750 [Allorhodopirellula solitaria]